MRRLPALTLAAVLVCSVAVASAQSTSIHQQILKTYSFQPHVLSTAEINAKSGILDDFWNAAKRNPSVYVPALRTELRDFKNPQFFLYDGRMLLSLSDTPDDRNIALAAMAHCDLRDVQSKDYFSQVHRMASLNADTTAAGFKILADPKFQVFIPQHSLMLAQNYCLVYMLLPGDQAHWEEPAIKRLQSERDETAQKSLVLLLWYAQNDEAENAIKTFAADSNKPKSARDYANEILSTKHKVGPDVRLKAAPYSEASLRQKRQDRMKAVSDEALYDLDNYTMMILAKRK